MAGKLQAGTYAHHPLVHSPGPLLAAGYCPVVFVSIHLADAVAIPVVRYCRRRRLPIHWCDLYAPCPDFGEITGSTYFLHRILSEVSEEVSSTAG